MCFTDLSFRVAVCILSDILSASDNRILNEELFYLDHRTLFPQIYSQNRLEGGKSNMFLGEVFSFLRQEGETQTSLMYY